MRAEFAQWRHVFKLDPAKDIDDASLHKLADSGTDAFIVGGSDDVTAANTYELYTRIRKFDLPIILEVTNEEAVVPGFDHYFIPTVLNTKDVKWIIGKHQQVVKQFEFPLPWDQIAAEAYVILNANCKAAQLAQADASLSLEDICAYAKLAEHFYRFPIFYMEYSGAYGNMEWVKTVRRELHHARLFYGGGIDNEEKAVLASQAADTIVVGNIIYENLEQALSTAAAVKRSKLF